MPVVPPSVESHSTSYDVIGSPESSGASNETVIFESPGMTEVGASGVPGSRPARTGRTRLGSDRRREFVANRVHVYVLPFVSPVTLTGSVSVVALDGSPPSLEVQSAVKLVIVSPASLTVSPVSTSAPWFAGVTTVPPTMVGVPTMTSADASERSLVPASLVAVTVQL